MTGVLQNSSDNKYLEWWTTAQINSSIQARVFVWNRLKSWLHDWLILGVLSLLHLWNDYWSCLCGFTYMPEQNCKIFICHTYQQLLLQNSSCIFFFLNLCWYCCNSNCYLHTWRSKGINGKWNSAGEGCPLFVPAWEQGAFCQVISFVLLASLHYLLKVIVVIKWQCTFSVVLILYQKRCASWTHILAPGFRWFQYFSSTHFKVFFQYL